MEIAEAFEDVKYEELLIILLQNQPEPAGVFFDFNCLYFFFDFKVLESIVTIGLKSHGFCIPMSGNKFIADPQKYIG